MNSSLILQSSHGIMARDDGDYDDDGDDGGGDREYGSVLSLSESSESMDGESMDDATSAPPLVSDGRNEGPLYEMSSLIAQLPFKRGLSKCYEGKSKSFTSLADAKNSKDLKKPRRSFCKNKIKPVKCKSTISTSNLCSKVIVKKNTSRGALHSLLSPRNHGFMDQFL